MPSSLVKCPTCGKNNLPTAKTCLDCGGALRGTVLPTKTVPPPTTYTTAPPTPLPGSPKIAPLAPPSPPMTSATSPSSSIPPMSPSSSTTPSPITSSKSPLLPVLWNSSVHIEGRVVDLVGPTQDTTFDWSAVLFQISFAIIGFFVYLVMAVFDRNVRVPHTGTQRWRKDRVFYTLRVEILGRAIREVRVDGHFSSGSVRFGEQVSVVGRDWRGTLIAWRIENHTTGAVFQTFRIFQRINLILSVTILGLLLWFILSLFL